MELRLFELARAVAAMTLIVVVGACAPTSTGPLGSSPSPQASSASTPSKIAAPSEAPTATPIVNLADLVPYVNRELGYEISVPRSWGEGADRVNAEGVHDFGSGRGFGTHGFPAFSISVGTSDGSVTVCQGTGHGCEGFVAADIADLGASLISNPAGLPGREAAGEAVLSGVDARFKRPRYRNEQASHGEFGIGGAVMGNCLGCPGMLYHVYTVDDGRPVVISIDWWTLAFEDLPSQDAGRILSSFRFRDR